MASVVSSTLPARRRLIRDVLPLRCAIPMSDDQHLTFDEARVVLASLQGDAYNCGIEVMTIITALDVFSREIRAHPEVANSELLRLLTWRGVIAEWGARALYNRTGRGDLAAGLPFIVDISDWERYLAAHDP